MRALSNRSLPALFGLPLVSIAVTAPLAISGARQAAAGALVSVPERHAVLDALQGSALLSVRAADATGDAARLGADGRDDTVWSGRAGEAQWVWTAQFARPVHLGLVRAHFGWSATSGVPTVFHWEVRGPASAPGACADAGAADWSPLDGASRDRPLSGGDGLAEPTRASWFADVEACGLRLVIDRTNAGPPVLREVEALESARDVLLGGARATDDGAYPGFSADGAIDGRYASRWVGAPGKGRWALRVDLPTPQVIDRIRLVLGFDATSTPRAGGGRAYAVAWSPLRYTLETSEDGKRFAPVATEVTRPDGTIVPLRRRLVTLSEPKPVRAIRLVMVGATGALGVPDPGAGAPVVRELAAYAAGDPRPLLAAPWILSINANPSGQSRFTPGGELTNDAYHAKFLQLRFAPLLPALARDDRYARALGSHGEPLDAPARDSAGEALESIEGDDPQLDAQLLSESSPPPIAVLSGSNDWDYAFETGPDPASPKRWHWDPLRDARAGGMGQLAPAVRGRVAPFLGFCGGAQLLALLEAKRGDGGSPAEDLRTIDRVLRRTNGVPIRGFAPPVDVLRAWPTDPHPQRAKIQFEPSDPLFVDLAGSRRRTTTQALPELHSDAIRPDAFAPGHPLQRFELLAQSAFCGPDVANAAAADIFPNPNGPGWCDPVTEAFRSRDRSWPVIGAQFHPEQRDFTTAAPGDPPESVSDARLFVAAAFEDVVDATVRLGL